MRTIFRPVILLALAGWLALMCSCAGNQNSLTAPTITANSSEPQGRVLLGVYNLNLGTDGEFSITEIRSGESHVNVTKSLFPPKCLDCFLAELVDKVGELWQFKFTIKNPFNITGYDCRVTLIKQGDILALNPSSYTKVFALPTDPDPINPFLIFDSGNGQNEWGPGAQAASYVTLQKPTGSKFTQVCFVIDGSFPSNQEDPYILTNITAKPPSVDVDGSDGTNIAVTVLDWQNNVNTVTVDLSPLGGSGTEDLTNIFGNMWLIEDVHYSPGGLGVGTYNLLLTASSTGNKTYNYVQIKVTEDGATDFWVEINQETDKADTGQDVEFTAIPHNGTGPYYYDWDMNYDLITFNPDINGETVKWNWSEAGTYNIRLKAESYDGQTATADTTILIGQASPSTGWARTWGGGVWYDIAQEPAVDDLGNVYVTGFFCNETVDFDPGPGVDNHTSNGAEDVFLCKYDKNGQFQWARTWGGAEGDDSRSITLDGVASIYVTGYFRGNVDFDPGPGVDSRIANGIFDVFISKFDSLGEFISVQTLGSTSSAFGNDIVATDSGDIIVSGAFGGLTDFDPGGGTDFHNSNGGGDAFLLKLGSEGNYLWANTWGGTGDEEASEAVVGNSGNIYVTGSFWNTVDFDPGLGSDTRVSNGYSDAFLSKFDSNGGYLWARTWGGNDPGNMYWPGDKGCGIAEDGSGNIYVSGHFGGTVDFDPGPESDIHVANGVLDAYVSNFDSYGNYVWSRTWGSSKWDEARKISVDYSGNIYVSGMFMGTVDFDPGAGLDNHTSAGENDMSLSKFNADGSFQWARTWGSTAVDCVGRAGGVATDHSGSVFVTGGFTYSLDFDPGPGVDNHTAKGWYDAFLVKFLPSGYWE